MGERRTFPLVSVLLVGGVFAYAFYHLWHVLIPFALSFALAYVLMPVVNAAQLRGLRREVGLIALYGGGLLAAVLLANTLFSIASMELSSLQNEGPMYAARLKAFALNLQMSATRKLPFGGELGREINARALGPLLDQVQSLPSYLLSLLPVLSLAFLIPFITFFFLLDGSRSIDWLIQTCPSRLVEQALHLISEIDHSLGAYLRGLILVAFAITAASFVGLVVLGVNQALWISVLSGVSSFVPYLGAIVGALVGGLLAWVQFGTAVAGLKVVGLFVLIRLGDEALLQPYIAKHSAHLPTLVYLLTFMIGGEVFGFMGLIFAVPAACVIKALVEVAWSWYSSEAQLQVSEVFDLAEIPYT